MITLLKGLIMVAIKKNRAIKKFNYAWKAFEKSKKMLLLSVHGILK